VAALVVPQPGPNTMSHYTAMRRVKTITNDDQGRPEWAILSCGHRRHVLMLFLRRVRKGPEAVDWKAPKSLNCGTCADQKWMLENAK
jgi:hypothetical protein